VSVATTSTTTGANLLVGRIDADDKTARVRKYEFIRLDDKATSIEAKQVSEVVSTTQPASLGGD
jgi:hypothetical protein